MISLIKKDFFIDIIFSVIMGLSIVIGKSIYETHSFLLFIEKPLMMLLLFVLSTIITIAVFNIINYLLQNSFKLSLRIKLLDKFYQLKFSFFIVWGLLFLVHLICYLSYFPGPFAYDTPSHTVQALGLEAWTNHQPVLHTLIWKFFLTFETIIPVKNIALILYSFVQITAVTALCTYIIFYVKKLSNNGIITTMVFLYYLLTPTLHIFSIEMTKDVPFSCFLTLFILNLYELQVSTKKFNLLCLITGLLACFFRNNMVYAIAFALVINIIIFIVTKKKNVIIPLLIAIIILFYGITKIIYPIFSIAPTYNRETIPIPIQQLSGVRNNHPEKLTEQEIKFIDNAIPCYYNFNPRNVDRVKTSFNEVWYKDNKNDFWRNYLNIFSKNIPEFIAIFLDVNVDYWYVNASFPDPYSNRDYIETSVFDVNEYKIYSNSIFPRLYFEYEKFAHFKSGIQRLPIFYIYNNLAFTFLLLIFVMYFLFKNKKSTALTAMLIFTGLFLTYLLGPLSNFRYVYPFYFAIPIILTICIKKGASR